MDGWIDHITYYPIQSILRTYVVQYIHTIHTYIHTYVRTYVRKKDIQDRKEEIGEVKGGKN